MSVYEEWRPVVGAEGKYSVSSLGRVRSEKRDTLCRDGATRHRHEKILKLFPDGGGYLQAGVSYKTGLERRKVHHLVTEAFIGPRPKGYEVRHLNGVNTDNRFCNLAYGTHSENVVDTIDHGTNVNSSKGSCLKGHIFSEHNTYVSIQANGRPRRQCRKCVLAAVVKYQNKKSV